MEIVTQTAIEGLRLEARDEFRDIYALPHEKQLVVYTDRMSIAGAVLDKPVPYRGVIQNQISMFWKNKFTHLVGHNMVAQTMDGFPPEARPYEAALKGRAVLIQKLKDLPMRFRVVGNLVGEDWDAYQSTRIVGGQMLPKGMRLGDRLEKAIMIVIPAIGRSRPEVDDMNKWAQRMYGPMLFKSIEDICLSIFGVARNYALARGYIIANTVFDLAVHEGTAYIIDDVMTPDSSTFWSAASAVSGRVPPNFTRQFLDEWLAGQEWDPKLPLPEVPQEIMTETAKRYRAIFDLMTGKVAAQAKE